VETDADGSVPMDVFFGLVRERFGLAEPAEELWRSYRARLPYLVSCPGEVLDGLDRLRAAGWAAGIVTNGMADNQTGKIRRTGLAERVDGWAISGAEGVRKPDVRLFEIGARRCGRSLAGGGWMVGDDPEKDVVGGRAAGLRTIWIDRGVAVADGADHVVTDVVAAMGLLMGMKAGGPGL
jgi:FMN phosphatase YigB (HAD superfamily)